MIVIKIRKVFKNYFITDLDMIFEEGFLSDLKFNDKTRENCFIFHVCPKKNEDKSFVM